jgi:hypothetical protein
MTQSGGATAAITRHEAQGSDPRVLRLKLSKTPYPGKHREADLGSEMRVRGFKGRRVDAGRPALCPFSSAEPGGLEFWLGPKVTINSACLESVLLGDPLKILFRQHRS